MSFLSQIIAVGRLKTASPLASPYGEYAKRLQGKIELIELEGHTQKEELKKIKDKLSPSSIIIALDEIGKTLSSIDLAHKIYNLQTIKPSKVQFIIGGADGLDDDIRNRADLVLSFGKMTWPHMLARVMLIEQIYRTHSILSNHPYHREG